MKRTSLNVLMMALTMVFSLCLLTACGGGGQASGGSTQSAEPQAEAGTDAVDEDIPSIEGAWDDDANGYSLVFYSDGSCYVTTYAFVWEGTYSWDGEYLELEVSESGMSGSGYLDEDGNLVVDDILFISVSEPYYTPDAIAGGSEADLEGEWVHTSDLITLYFDGLSTVTFENSDTGESGIGSYGFDGTTLTIAAPDSDGVIVQYSGETDSFGDLAIELWDEGGWYELEE